MLFSRYGDFAASLFYIQLYSNFLNILLPFVGAGWRPTVLYMFCQLNGPLLPYLGAGTDPPVLYIRKLVCMNKLSFNWYNSRCSLHYN